MIEIESGERYTHEEYGTVKVTEVVQYCTDAVIVEDDGEPHIDAATVGRVYVEFELVKHPASGFGPTMEKLAEFVESVDLDV